MFGHGVGERDWLFDQPVLVFGSLLNFLMVYILLILQFINAGARFGVGERGRFPGIRC